jgi:hypothetical protein
VSNELNSKEIENILKEYSLNNLAEVMETGGLVDIETYTTKLVEEIVPKEYQKGRVYLKGNE